MRDAFLQQQVGGLDLRRTMEAMAHRPVMHRIGEGDQGHALMMGHVAADDGNPLAFRQPDGGEIQCLIEAETTQAPFPLQAIEIFHGGMGQVHRGQRRGVGCNHQIFA